MSEGQFECVGHGFLSSQNIRGRWYILACVCLLFSFVGCSTQSLRSIAITPAAGTETLSQGQSVQYKALGSYVQGTHPANIVDITSAASWSSSNTAVATVSSGGLVTAVGPGSTPITASANGQNGIESGASDVTVTSVNTANQGLTSITIVPGGQSLVAGQTVQFIAIGNYATDPTTRDLTSLVTWSSSVASVASINSFGLATSLGGGNTTIIANYAPTTKSPVVTASTALSTSGGVPPYNLPTVTIYMAGSWTSQATVKASYVEAGGATITPITCTIASSSAASAPSTNSQCTNYFPYGVQVTLTVVTTPTGKNFGGWSTPPCTLILTTPCIFNIQQLPSTYVGYNNNVVAIFN